MIVNLPGLGVGIELESAINASNSARVAKKEGIIMTWKVEHVLQAEVFRSALLTYRSVPLSKARSS